MVVPYIPETFLWLDYLLQPLAISAFLGRRDSCTDETLPPQHQADLVLFLFLPLDEQKAAWLRLPLDF